MLLYLGHLPLLAIAQILFFLDSGSLLFPLPNRFTSSSHSSVNSYLPSSLKCLLLPEFSLGPLLYRVPLWPFFSCPPPHRVSRMWVREKGSLRTCNALPLPPVLIIQVLGTQAICLSDSRPLLGLGKAWLDRPLPGSASGVTMPLAGYT